MSAEVMNGASAVGEAKIEVVCATCECCGLMEECTPAYVARVRERYDGKWVCGLCVEAVKDEIGRAERRISVEEALVRHMRFSERFRSEAAKASPVVTAEHLIAAMRQLLRRGLDSPRVVRSAASSPSRSSEEGGSGRARRSLARTESCGI